MEEEEDKEKPFASPLASSSGSCSVELQHLLLTVSFLGLSLSVSVVETCSISLLGL